MRYQAPEIVDAVSLGDDSVKYLKIVDIQLTDSDNCNIYSGYVIYGPLDAVADQGPASGAWPQGVEQTIQVSVSSTQVTSHNVYMSGGEVADQGTRTDRSKGYSQQGFPVDIPTITYSIRRRYPNLPSGWSANQASKVGKINNAEFLGNPIGSVKYKGMSTNDFPASGSAGQVQVTLLYEYSPPCDEFTVNGMQIPAKEGWDLYDFTRYDSDEGTVLVGYQILRPYIKADISTANMFTTNLFPPLIP